jgi:hypothetical protein
MIGIYIAISQVLAFTPVMTIQEMMQHDQQDQISSITLILLGFILIIYLIIIGIGHHACNMITASIGRIRMETYHVKAMYEQDNSMTDINIDRYVRKDFSLSKVTGTASLLCAGVLHLLVYLKFFQVIKFVTSNKSQEIVIAIQSAFFVVNTATIIFFCYVMFNRLNQFYVAQTILRMTRQGVDGKEIQEYLHRKGIAHSSS